MPDSAVNPARQVADVAGSHRTDAASVSASASSSKSTSAGLPAESDADAKLARAARSAQRLALLSRAPYGAPTLDLFAEDAERATLQALNTDIRQSTLPGFELPEVFMAAVPGEDGSTGVMRAWRSGASSVDGRGVSSDAESRDDAAATQSDSQTADAATLELEFDDVLASHEVIAGPVQPKSLDDGAQGAPVAMTLEEANARGPNKRASAARARGAARNVSIAAPSPAAATSEVEMTKGNDGRTDPDKKRPGDSPNASNADTKPAGSAPANNPARPAATPHRVQPQSLAAALIDDDRRTRASASSAPQPSSRAASELDTARASAYADTIDALYAVIADQRGAAAVLSRRVKAIFVIVIGVLIVTVAAGVAQSVALAQLARENTAQQQRIEQLMLTQQATLASFFDTDSDTIEVPNRGNTNAAAANRNQDAEPYGRAAKRVQGKVH